MKELDWGVRFSMPSEEEFPETVPPEGRVEVSIKSDLMDSRETASPLGSQKHMKAVTHPEAGLLVFSIGTDGHLYMVRKNQGQSGAWLSEDIGRKLVEPLAEGAGTTVQAFALLPREEGALALLCAVTPKENPSGCRFWLAKALDPAHPDQTQWTPVGEASQFQAEFMVMSRVPESGRADAGEWVAIACGKASGKPFLSARMARLGKEESWKELQIGADLESIVDLKFGSTMLGGFGFYVLGTYGQRRPFYFVSFDGSDANRPTKLTGSNFSRFKNIAAFEVETVLEGDYQGYSNLFFVDSDTNFPEQNVIKFVDAASQRFGEVKSFATLSRRFEETARGLHLTRDDLGNSALYMHAIHKGTGAGSICRTSRASQKDQPTAAWTPLFTLEREVELLSPAASATGRVSELFVLGKDNANIRYLWQDERTSVWKREEVMVASPRNVVPTSCWHTRLRFSDGTGCPIDFRKYKESGSVTIEAFESCSVEINHKKYAMEPQKRVELKPEELSGGLDLISNITALHAPLFRIQAPFLSSGAIEIDPAAKIKRQFADLSVEQLRNPKDRYNDPLGIKLVEGEHAAPEYLEGILPGIRQMAGFTRKPPPELASARLLQGTTPQAMEREGVRMVAPGAPFSTELDLSHLPEGVLFSIDFRGPTPLFLDTRACRRQGIAGLDQSRLADGFWDDLAKFFGNFIEAVKNAVQKATLFIVEVVKEGLLFTIHLAEEVIHCLVRFAEQVLVTIGMVLKKYLNIDLSKLIRWLAFLFSGKDIQAMQRYTARQINEGFDSLKKKVLDFETQFKKDLREIDERLKKMALPEQMRGRKISALIREEKESAKVGREKEFEALQEYSNNDPGMNWLSYKLGDPASLVMDTLFPKLHLKEEITRKLQAFLEEELVPLYEKGKADIEDIRDFIRNILENQSELTLEEILEKLGILFARFGLGVAGGLVAALMKVIAEILDVSEKILNAEIDLPILSSLYKELVGDELSALNVLCLMLAIPSVLLCKVVTGKAPVTDEVLEAPGRGISEPLFWVNLAGVWCLNSIQMVLLPLSITANWADAAPVGNLIFALNTLLQGVILILAMTWCVCWCEDPKNPETEKWVLSALLVIQAFDWFVGVMMTSLLSDPKKPLPRPIPQILGILRSFTFGILFGVAYIIQLVFRVINAGKDWRKISLSALFLAHQESRALAGFVVACGNLMPKEGKPAIAKALLHGSAHYVSEIAWWAHNVRAVVEIVFRYAPKELTAGETDGNRLLAEPAGGYPQPG